LTSNDLQAVARVHFFNASAPAIQVRDHVTHVLLGNDNLDIHHRLDQDRLCPLQGVLEGHATGDLEGHLRRIDIVERAIINGRLNTFHLIAGQWTAFHCLANPLPHGRNVLTRNRTASDLVDELELLPLLGREWLDLDDRVAELASPACLPDEATFPLGGGSNRFAIGNLRPADVGLNTKFPEHAVNQDLQMQLAHSGDYGLSRLLVAMALECRVFLRQLGQRLGELLLVGPRLGLDGHRDHRLHELH